MGSAASKLSKEPAYSGSPKESALFPAPPAPGSIPAEDPNPIRSSSAAQAAQSPVRTAYYTPPLDTDPFYTLRHNVSLIAVAVCPALALLPPRKLDLYTFSLGFSTALAGNNLLRDYSGQGVWERIDRRRSRLRPRPGEGEGSPAPAKLANEVKAESAEALARARTAGKTLEQPGQLGEKVTQAVLSDIGPPAKSKLEAQQERERTALEDGEGYWGLMKSQVWEVWNWNKRYDKNGDVHEADEHIEEDEEKRWEALRERALKGGKSSSSADG